jgi:hypothetical protein
MKCLTGCGKLYRKPITSPPMSASDLYTGVEDDPCTPEL